MMAGGMKEKLHIEIRQDDGTEEYYLHFIEWSGITHGNEGYWSNRKIDEKTYKMLLKLCYPFWDGKHQAIRCQDEYEPSTGTYSRDKHKGNFKCIDCPLDCPDKLTQDEWHN